MTSRVGELFVLPAGQLTMHMYFVDRRVLQKGKQTRMQKDSCFLRYLLFKPTFNFKSVMNYSYSLFIPHHKIWGGGLYWIRFVASVGRSVSQSVGPSVGPSVRPSQIRVRSITPLLMEGFPSNLNDTFTLTRGCAEPMLPLCQLKVKVIVKCQINQNKIYIHLKTL